MESAGGKALEADAVICSPEEHQGSRDRVLCSLKEHLSLEPYYIFYNFSLFFKTQQHSKPIKSKVLLLVRRMKSLAGWRIDLRVQLGWSIRNHPLRKVQSLLARTVHLSHIKQINGIIVPLNILGSWWDTGCSGLV